MDSYSYNEDKMLAGIQAYRDEQKKLPMRPPPQPIDLLPVHMKRVVEVASRRFSVTVEELRSDLRGQRAVRAREAVSLIARTHYQCSYPQIGRIVNRHHSTTQRAIREAQERYEQDKLFRSAVDFISSRVEALAEKRKPRKRNCGHSITYFRGRLCRICEAEKSRRHYHKRAA